MFCVFASAFCSREMSFFLELVKGFLVYLDQCEYGVPSRKPTHLACNDEWARGLSQRCSHGHSHPAAIGLTPTGPFKTISDLWDE